MADIWFHRYEGSDQKDIEGRCKLHALLDYPSLLTSYLVDYNSWIESEDGLKLASKLDKDTVLAEGTSYSTNFDTLYTANASKATRNTKLIGNIWPLWAIGVITKTRKSSLMVLEVSISL